MNIDCFNTHYSIAHKGKMCACVCVVSKKQLLPRRAELSQEECLENV